MTGSPNERESQGIAVCAQKQTFALRLKPRDDAGQNRLAANFAQRLIASAHSARQTAREHDPWYVERFRHPRRLVAYGKRTLANSACVIVAQFAEYRVGLTGTAIDARPDSAQVEP